MRRKKITVDGHSVTTYSEGSGDDILLVLHGGPGVPCSYVRDAHLRYAKEGFRVVSWDQLGCGESDRPDDPSLWQIPRFVEEVETVRTTLGLGKVYLLGNSWGGMLSTEYCLKYQDNVHCAVIGNIAFSMPLLQDGFRRVKQNLGDETVRMMALRESEGTTDHPEYKAAVDILLYRHLCRMEEWPEAVASALDEGNRGRGPMTAMFGPHLFNCTGNLRDWDRNDDLHRITIPVMLVSGEHDYVLPEFVNMATDYFPDVEYVMCRGAGHMPFWETPDVYHPRVSAFLNKHRK